MARKENPRPLPPDAEGVAGTNEEYLKLLMSRLSDQDRRVVEGMAKVKSIYVDCGRDDVLRRSFDFFVRDFMATRNGKRDEADVFFVTGESGAGKSEAIHRLLSSHPLLAPVETAYGTIKPCVSIKLSGYTLPRLAGRRIVAASGYTIRAGDEARGEIWDKMAGYLKVRGTLFVHIDETQHLIARNAGEKERQKLADAIKGVSIDKDWSVAFILSGLPSVVDIPFYDEQFERRGRFVEFTDVRMPEEEKLIHAIVRRLANAVGISPDAVVKSDVPRRLAHAANYRYGRACKAVVSAIHEALDAGASSLTRAHFAEAYVKHSQAFGDDAANPFLSERWQDLAPGSFIIRDDKNGA